MIREVLTLLATPAIFITLTFFFSLLIGSFLNVVIHRLPIMMEREWRAQALELLGRPAEPGQPYNLAVPRSACPTCAAPITALQNIPVVSWLLLRGRCAHCHAKISWRYPLIELLTAALSAAIAWKFGATLQGAAGLLITWSLIALAAIDWDTLLLPDSIVAPLLWCGLVASLVPVFVGPPSSLIGAALGYGFLWTILTLFTWLLRREAMGFGDLKLLAALGAWLGWQVLLPITFMAAAGLVVIGTASIVLQGKDRRIPLAFGPYLAIAGWVCLMWREPIVAWISRWTGLV